MSGLMAAAAAAVTAAATAATQRDTTTTTLTCLGVQARAVDLSWPLDDTTIYWPGGAEGFKLCMQCVDGPGDNDFYSAGTVSTAEHGGTHVDAPWHFAKHGRKVDELTMGDLIGPAFVIDVSARSAPDAPGTPHTYLLTADDILQFEATHQLPTLPAGAIVLIRTGWAANWAHGAKVYLGFDEATDGPYDTRTSDLAFPGISKAAAELLVTRRVAGVGIDTASIDAGACKDFVVHKVLLGNNVYGIENLNTRLREVPPVGATLFVLPMKIHGSGAPARVVALCP